MALWIIGGIVAAIVLVWAILDLVTHIGGKKFDRDWENASPEERFRSRFLSQARW